MNDSENSVLVDLLKIGHRSMSIQSARPVT